MNKRLEVFDHGTYESYEDAEKNGALYTAILTLNDVNVDKAILTVCKCLGSDVEYRVVDDTIKVDRLLFDHMKECLYRVFDGEEYDNTHNEKALLYRSEINYYFQDVEPKLKARRDK